MNKEEYPIEEELEEFMQLSNRLMQENKQLKERVEYLERSNNRREETIIEERKEISDLEDKIDKALKHIEEHKLVYENQYEYESKFDNHLLEILKGE